LHREHLDTDVPDFRIMLSAKWDSIMKKLSSISVSIKLNFLLLMVLVVLLTATVLLLISNTNILTQEIGSERVTEEVKIIQKRLAEQENELDVDVNFMASSIPFIQAVGRRSESAVTDLISSANQTLKMDDIDVVDGDGKRLADLNSGANGEATLLRKALGGTATGGIFARNNGQQIQVSLGVAAPVKNLRQGTVLGAIQMNRHLNDAFLRDLIFARDGVYLGMIYQGRLLARTSPSADGTVHGDIVPDKALVERASSGEVVVSSQLITSGNIPYAVAYVPLSFKGISTATLMILVELNEITAFQSSTLLNTILVFTVLAVLAIIVIYLSLQRIAIHPLITLKKIAQEMKTGQYDRRIPVSGRDEVGQLAESFNEMAEAIQQRETNLQAARARAERAEKVKSAFLASMSHELRTPLNAVINFTRFVIEGDTGPVTDQQAELLTEVVNSGRHLLNLINDVLDMSKIEAGSLNLFIEDDIDLNALLSSAVPTARSLLNGKPVRLQTSIDTDLPLIRADRQRVLQIVLNLVSNACKFTEEGEINITAYQQAGEIVVSVADTGPGIAPEDQAMVFEAFKQTTTGLRQGGGTGLGMPIAKSLAEAHGGRLWLESEYGKGTTFFLALPVKSDALVPVV
jgi:signal transduction histidine kinase